MNTNGIAYQVLMDIYKNELKEDSTHYAKFEFSVNQNKVFLYPDLKWFLDAVFIFTNEAEVSIKKVGDIFEVTLQKDS